MNFCIALRAAFARFNGRYQQCQGAKTPVLYRAFWHVREKSSIIYQGSAIEWRLFFLMLVASLWVPAIAQAQIAVRGASNASIVTTLESSSSVSIQLKNESKQGTTGTYIDLQLPNNREQGFIMLAQVVVRGNVTISTPPEWTLINSSSTSKLTQAVYWRIENATTNETPAHRWHFSTSTSTTTTYDAAGTIMMFSGANSSNPIETWAVGVNTSTDTFALPAVGTANSNAVLVASTASAHTNNHGPIDGFAKNSADQTVGNTTDGIRASGWHKTGSTSALNPPVGATADNIVHVTSIRPSNASDLTINVPAGTTSGDAMIASVLIQPCSSTSGSLCYTTITPPTGWTLLRSLDTLQGQVRNSRYGSRLFVYSRVATATEPTRYIWRLGYNNSSLSSLEVDAAGGIVSFSGVDKTNPVISESGQVTGSGLTHSTPSISVGSAPSVMLVTTYAANRATGWKPDQTSAQESTEKFTRPLGGAGAGLAMYSESYTLGGDTGVRSATFEGNTTGNTGATYILALRPGSAGPYKLEIQHSGTGVTCSPTTLTIKACADSTCSTLYTAGDVTGTLTATGTPTVNWDGSTGGASGAGFKIAAGSGSVTKKVQVTTPGSVDFGVTSVIPTPSNAPTCTTGSSTSCTFTAADAGFLLSAPDHVSETQSTLTIKAIRKSDSSLSCMPAFASVTKSVNLKCSYVNPSSGTLSARIADSALGASATSICSSTGMAVSFAFDSTGVATPTLQYADVGKMQIDATFTGTSGTEQGLSMVGNTQFIAAPHSFAFSGITAAPIKAGASFSATVTARNSAAAATPNFGKEASPEGVTLSSTLVAPAGGAHPVLSNRSISGSSFNNGAATVSTLSWGEAGTLTLGAALTNSSYLGVGTGVAAPTGTSSSVRFIPNHFDTIVSGGMACPTGVTCPTTFNGFVYSGQSFTTKVIARNAGGTTTLNYDSSRAHSNEVVLTAWDAAGSTTDNNPSNGAMSGNTVPASAFLLGEGTVATPAYTLPNAFPSATAPPGPTNIYIRATESNADGVTSLRAGSSVEGGIAILSGRALINNAYGSELLRLPTDFIVQYWNGANWTTSATDSLTSFAPSNVTFANCTLNLVQSGTSAPANCKPVVQASSSPSVLSVTNGRGRIVLNAPGTGNNGSADLRLDAPAYLPSTTARARFGINKGRLIYLREMY